MTTDPCWRPRLGRHGRARTTTAGRPESLCGNTVGRPWSSERRQLGGGISVDSRRRLAPSTRAVDSCLCLRATDIIYPWRHTPHSATLRNWDWFRLPPINVLSKPPNFNSVRVCPIGGRRRRPIAAPHNCPTAGLSNLARLPICPNRPTAGMSKCRSLVRQAVGLLIRQFAPSIASQTAPLLVCRKCQIPVCCAVRLPACHRTVQLPALARLPLCQIAQAPVDRNGPVAGLSEAARSPVCRKLTDHRPAQLPPS